MNVGDTVLIRESIGFARRVLITKIMDPFPYTSEPGFVGLDLDEEGRVIGTAAGLNSQIEHVL